MSWLIHSTLGFVALRHARPFWSCHLACCCLWSAGLRLATASIIRDSVFSQLRSKRDPAAITRAPPRQGIVKSAQVGLRLTLRCLSLALDAPTRSGADPGRDPTTGGGQPNPAACRYAGDNGGAANSVCANAAADTGAADADVTVNDAAVHSETEAMPLYHHHNAQLAIDFRVRRLPLAGLQVMDPRLVRIAPGARNECYRHGHESFFVVLSGEGELRLGSQSVPLKAGDVASVLR